MMNRVDHLSLTELMATRPGGSVTQFSFGPDGFTARTYTSEGSADADVDRIVAGMRQLAAVMRRAPHDAHGGP